MESLLPEDVLLLKREGNVCYTVVSRNSAFDIADVLTRTIGILAHELYGKSRWVEGVYEALQPVVNPNTLKLLKL